MNSISTVVVPRSGKIEKLKVNAKKKLMFSNNVTELNVVSSLEEADIDRHNLTYMTIGANVSALLPMCFADCTSLVSVKSAGSKLKNIDSKAFYNCTSLSHVDAISKSNKTKLHNIGLSAFANSGIEEAYISLSGTSTSTQVQAFAFANCPRLTAMTNVGSNYIADYEFANCSALRSVTFPNSHSFMGSYAFYNCTNLPSAVIPSNTWAIGEGMFKGCSNLTSITFDEPGSMVDSGCLNNDMLSGTPLTSLTLPSSIKSYDCFSDFALRGLPNLKEIHFNGFDLSTLATVTKSTKKIRYEFGCIYFSESEPYYTAYSSSANKQKYNSTWKKYVKNISPDYAASIIYYCLSYRIPVLVIAGGGKTCGACMEFGRDVVATSTFFNWLRSDKNKFIVVDISMAAADGNKKSRSLINKFDSPASGTYAFPVIMAYWQKDSKTVYKRMTTGKVWKKASEFVSAMQKYCNGYTKPAEISYIIESDIAGTGCFGLYHDVKLFAKDG